MRSWGASTGTCSVRRRPFSASPGPVHVHRPSADVRLQGPQHAGPPTRRHCRVIALSSLSARCSQFPCFRVDPNSRRRTNRSASEGSNTLEKAPFWACGGCGRPMRDSRGARSARSATPRPLQPVRLRPARPRHRNQPNRQQLGEEEDGCRPRSDALVLLRLQPVPCAQNECGGVRSQAKERQSNRLSSVATIAGMDRGRRWLEAHLGPRGESRRLANDRFGRRMLGTRPRRPGVDRAVGESTRRSHHRCLRKATTGLPVLLFPLSPSLRGQTIRPDRGRCCSRLHVDAAILGNAGQRAPNSPVPG